MDKKEADENELIDLLPIIYSASPPGKLPPNKFQPQKAMLLHASATLFILLPFTGMLFCHASGNLILAL